MQNFKNFFFKSFLGVVSLLVTGLGIFAFVAMSVEAYNLPEPWFDDAFMYIRYAKNILRT